MGTYLDGNRQFNQTHQQNIEELRKLSKQRRPVGYDPQKLRDATVQWQLAQQNKWLLDGGSERSSKIYIGERGGRYYKRRRADGTTYREYTF